MRLLRKTARFHLLLSGTLLLLAGLLIYFLMTSIIEFEIREKLFKDKNRIVHKISNDKEVPELSPLIQVKMTASPERSSSTIKDTVIYEPIEDEKELYKELSTVERIQGNNYRITIRQVAIEPNDYIESIGGSLGVVLLLLLGGLYFGNRYISKSIWDPFYHNLSVLKHYSLEEDQAVHPRLKTSDITEFQEMDRAIENLTERIRADYNTLKEFSENASHEMQTPLAVIRTRLEELLQDPNLSEEQANSIRSVLSASSKLSRSNQTLLLLAKLDNQQFSKTSSVDLFEMLNKELEQFSDILQEKGIELKKELKSVIIRKTDPSLVEMLLSNLFRNAIKHNLPGGWIEVYLNKGLLKISNSGPPISHEPQRMFERFRKGDPSSPSSGLGLSVVKKICDIHGWKVDYTVAEGRHRISITFLEGTDPSTTLNHFKR